VKQLFSDSENGVVTVEFLAIRLWTQANQHGRKFLFKLWKTIASRRQFLFRVWKVNGKDSAISTYSAKGIRIRYVSNVGSSNSYPIGFGLGAIHIGSNIRARWQTGNVKPTFASLVSVCNSNR
jgi:hypothetical protein